MPVIPIQFKPTFPLDEVRIRKMKRQAIWKSAKMLTVRAVANFTKKVFPDSDLARDAGDAWNEMEEELTARVVRQLVNESNVSQDEEIRKLMRNLNGVGKWQYAISLGKILLLKQRIESDLHRSSKLTERKKEVEILVDSMCNEVCQEIFDIAHLNDQLSEILTSGDQNRLDELTDRVSTGHSRIMRAYATLSGTSEKLTDVLQPGTERPGVTQRKKSELDRLIEVLREENEVSQAVEQRMRDELPDV